jgi:hypothetical protein
MEQINNIELHDGNIYPDDNVLKNVLGKSFEAYSELLKLFDEYEMTYDWRYYKDGKAWLCKVQKKKRTIVWMSAWKGYMKATIYFPGKYVDELGRLDIAEETKQKILETNNVGKSKPCTFEIKNKGIIKDFSKVMEYKIETK